MTNDGGYLVRFAGQVFPVATRSDLDKLPCETCGEPHAAPLVVDSQCHPLAGVRCVYFAGTIALACQKCGAAVVALVVSNEAPDTRTYMGGSQHHGSTVN